MKYLLDTHALLWWFTDDPKLSARARDTIADESNEIYVSAASAWEIATKYRLGKLTGVTDLLPRYSELVTADGFGHLAINYLHSLRAGGYTCPHRDPFNRMLAAQCDIEALTLISCDNAFKLFSTRVLW